MSADQRRQLFQPFTQLDTSPTRKFAGTGLGLSICKRLAEALGGDIEVWSEEGTGSRFTVRLPVHPPDQGLRWISAETINHQQANEPPSSMPIPVHLNGRVLIAEDSPDLSRLLRYQLTGAGLEVETADNGREAVEKAFAKTFDMIVMDMQMPVLDGYEAAKELRARGYQGPILALTAHAMRQDRDRCLQAGCTEYQAKPVDLPTLLAILDAHLGTSRTLAPKAPASESVKAGRGRGRLFTPPPVAENDPVFLELVREYAADLVPKRAALDDAFQKSDFVKLAKIAHQIRGSGGMYGFSELTLLAGELEDLARDFPGDPRLISSVEALSLLAQGIIEEFGEESTESSK